jgi:hypothetical protein
MDIGKFVELAKKLASEKKDDQVWNEHFRKLFERFHNLNRNYLDKETFEKTRGNVSSMAETIADTVRYLETEIAHFRSKRMKLPVDNLTLSEMQKVQGKNELFVKECVQEFEKA